MNMILAGTFVLSACVLAADTRLEVAACLSYPGAEPVAALRAKHVAGEIYKKIGVRIVWSRCAVSQDAEIRIQVAAKAPRDLTLGAYAYALPYEGKTVEIFYDRIRGRTRNYEADVFGHVLAHEIAHILQGVARHSESGIMKAHWNGDDREQMSWRPMQFTAYDADLIRTGILKRADKRLAVNIRSKPLE